MRHSETKCGQNSENFTAAVWCVPALRVPLVHSLINHFRQNYAKVRQTSSRVDEWTSARKREKWAAMRGAVNVRAQPRAALVSVLMTASQLASRGGGVDNILAAKQVRDRIDAGAVPLRIEADFVTCSQ